MPYGSYMEAPFGGGVPRARRYGPPLPAGYGPTGPMGRGAVRGAMNRATAAPVRPAQGPQLMPISTGFPPVPVPGNAESMLIATGGNMGGYVTPSNRGAMRRGSRRNAPIAHGLLKRDDVAPGAPGVPEGYRPPMSYQWYESQARREHQVPMTREANLNRRTRLSGGPTDEIMVDPESGEYIPRPRGAMTQPGFAGDGRSLEQEMNAFTKRDAEMRASADGGLGDTYSGSLQDRMRRLGAGDSEEKRGYGATLPPPGTRIGSSTVVNMPGGRQALVPNHMLENRVTGAEFPDENAANAAAYSKYARRADAEGNPVDPNINRVYTTGRRGGAYRGRTDRQAEISRFASGVGPEPANMTDLERRRVKRMQSRNDKREQSAEARQRARFGLPPAAAVAGEDAMGEQVKMTPPPVVVNPETGAEEKADLYSPEGAEWLSSMMDRGMTPEEFGKSFGTDENPYTKDEMRGLLAQLDDALTGPADELTVDVLSWFSSSMEEAFKKQQRYRDFLRRALGEEEDKPAVGSPPPISGSPPPVTTGGRSGMNP